MNWTDVARPELQVDSTQLFSVSVRHRPQYYLLSAAPSPKTRFKSYQGTAPPGTFLRMLDSCGVSPDDGRSTRHSGSLANR